MKWEYLTRSIRDGGNECYDMDAELNALGEEGWEFCSWVFEWSFSEGPAPHSRVALFKRRAESEKPAP